MKATTTLGSDQPAPGPWMMPKSSEPSPRMESTAPGRSILGALGSFDSGMK